MSIQPDDNAQGLLRALRSPWAALLAWTALLAGVIFAFWAPETSDDGHAHANWLHFYTEQVLSGELLPRWLTEANAGLGSPAFFYYPPMPYWAASLWAIGVPTSDGGWLLLSLSVVIALGLSGVTCFVWLRPHCGKGPALLASMLYMAMPYHLATDVFVRGALAELWGFVWMPLLLHLVARIAQGNRRATWALAPAYAGLLCSHPPTALMFSSVLPIYGLVKAAPGARIRVLLTLAGTTALGFGLAAFYLVPALGLRDLIYVEGMAVGRMADFLFDPGPGGLPALRGRVASRVSYSVLTLLTLSAISATAIVRRARNPEDRRETWMWILVGGAVLICTTPLSQFVWDEVPFIKTIQFAWRLVSILCVATTALLGMAFAASWSASRPWKLLAAVLFLAPLVTWAVMLPKEVGPSFGAEGRTQPDIPRLSEVMEYFPKPGPRDLPAILERLELPARANRPLPRLDPPGILEVRRWKARRIDLTATTSEPTSLTVFQFRYPGWEAHVNGHQVPLDLNVPDDVIRFGIPAGRSQIEVRLPLLPPERLGNRVSGMSLILLLLGGLAARRFWPAHSEQPREAGEP